MTERKDAITKLLAKVEAGEKYETMGHTILCQKAFPKPDNFDGSRKSYAESATQLAILAWRNGSLDAAKALHEAVLPEWHWYVSKYGVARIVIPSRLRPTPTVGRSDNNPARAWLIAILKALISDENTNTNDKGE
jgi:hypothetical protein